MDNKTIYHPAYIRVIERRVNGWAFRHGEPFINLYNFPWLSQKDLYATWGTSMKKVAIELFRINGGTQGYYLADLKDRKYYYCGVDFSSVKIKLQEIGIMNSSKNI